MTDDECITKTQKELENFKNEFAKLLRKYPNVTVSSNNAGHLMAYHDTTFLAKIRIW
jgi:hypothetical protein